MTYDITYFEVEEKTLYGRSHLLVQRSLDDKFAVIPSCWVLFTCRYNRKDQKIYNPVNKVTGLRLVGSEIEWFDSVDEIEEWKTAKRKRISKIKRMGIIVWDNHDTLNGGTVHNTPREFIPFNYEVMAYCVKIKSGMLAIAPLTTLEGKSYCVFAVYNGGCFWDMIYAIPGEEGEKVLEIMKGHFRNQDSEELTEAVKVLLPEEG